MENKEEKHLPVLAAISKCAGTGLGTVVAAGGQVTGTIKNSLTRPLIDFAPAAEQQNEPNPQISTLQREIESSAPKDKDDELTGNVTALQSDLAEVRSRLTEAQKQLDQMQSQFALQLSELQTQKDSLIFELEQAAKQVNELKGSDATLRARLSALESELNTAKTKLEKARSGAEFAKPQLLSQTKPVVLSTERQKDEITAIAATENKDGTESAVESDVPAAAVQNDDRRQDHTETEQFQSIIAETEVSVPADVTIEQVNTAHFDNPTDRVILIKALSDIAGNDKAVRVNAVKAMAGVHHILAVRALVAQMAKEPQAQIRAECLNALATLSMKEALPAIENALRHEAVSVRLAAVRGLYRLAGPQSASKLIRMLGDENEDVRRRTTACIGWLGSKELAVELVPLLDDGSVSVRLAAVNAMGNLRSPQVVAELIEHLNDPENVICRAVISALRTITGKQMGGPLPGNEKSLQLLIARWRQWWKENAGQISPA